MAIAGDVVIKLAADFAEFAKGMSESTKKLEEFGSVAAKVDQKIESFIGTVKGLFTVAALEQGIQRLRAYAETVAKTAADTDRLATSLGLTSEQTQALQVVSARTG